MRYQDQRAGLRSGVSFILVLTAHLALIGAALQLGATRAALKPVVAALESVMVDLTPATVAPSARPIEVPPGPAQQEQRRMESEIEQPPEPKLEVALDVNTLADLYTPPVQETAVANAAGDQQTTAPPAVNATPDTRYAAQQDSAGSSSEAMVTWQSLLLGHLERFKRYPRRAEQRRQEGVVYVRFSVDRKGNVRNERLGRSSGYTALDDETLAVLQRANPVPPPPAEIAGDPVEVMVPVTFYLRKG